MGFEEPGVGAACLLVTARPRSPFAAVWERERKRAGGRTGDRMRERGG